MNGCLTARHPQPPPPQKLLAVGNMQDTVGHLLVQGTAGPLLSACSSASTMQHACRGCRGGFNAALPHNQKHCLKAPPGLQVELAQEPSALFTSLFYNAGPTYLAYDLSPADSEPD